MSSITQLLLDGAWMRIPAVDLKSSSFQDSGSGDLSPVTALAPFSSTWGLGYKERGSLAGYIQIRWRPEEKI